KSCSIIKIIHLLLLFLSRHFAPLAVDEFFFFSRTYRLISTFGKLRIIITAKAIVIPYYQQFIHLKLLKKILKSRGYPPLHPPNTQTLSAFILFLVVASHVMQKAKKKKIKNQGETLQRRKPKS
ncbi:MAG: hypothetical protein P9X26_02130, partial [Candidatus Stygibacter frigidus]|nr:hypothetical protein [Candidatus Stygibacter frigidus]